MMFETLLKVQKQINDTKLVKDARAQYGSYLSLANLMDTVLPILNDAGVVLTQLVTVLDGQPALTTRLIAGANNEIESTMLLMLKSADPQGQGSAITYARRYAIISMLGIVADEDDDGNAAQTAATKPAVQKSATATQLEEMSRIMTAADVKKEDQMAVLKAVTANPNLNVRQISYLEAEKLIDDLKAASPDTLKNLANSEPF